MSGIFVITLGDIVGLSLFALFLLLAAIVLIGTWIDDMRIKRKKTEVPK